MEKFNGKQIRTLISKGYGYGFVLILALIPVLYVGLLDRYPSLKYPKREIVGYPQGEARSYEDSGVQRYKEVKVENSSGAKPKPVPSVPRSRHFHTPLSDSDLITFDDGPTPQTTPPILEVLDRYGVKANFFLEGERIRQYPYLAREILRRGHQLGYHSMWHQNLANFSREEIEQDIIHFRRIVRTYVNPNYRVILGRPPYGGFTKETVKIYFKYRKKGILSHIPIEELTHLVAPHIREAFQRQGLILQLWNVDMEDWEKPVNVNLAISELLKPGQQVLLLHELPLYTKTGRHQGSDAYLKLSAILKSLH